MKNIKTDLSSEELELVISALLFSSSINVTLTTSEEYQKRLVNLAIKLKSLKEDIQLNDIEFIKEDDYEDKFSEQILENFCDNLKVTSFDRI